MRAGLALQGRHDQRIARLGRRQPELDLAGGGHESELSQTGKLNGLEVAMQTPYVSRDSEIMSGALCFTGTRVPVQNLFDYLEGSSSLEEFLQDFPSVSREAAVAVLEAARERLFADAPAS
jgi:uncharacterized protein (DUF433 family)